MRIVRWIAAAVVAAITATLWLAVPAFAGPQANYFSAYDFRYEQPYSCFGQTCWTVPYTGGHASYFNAPALRTTPIRDSIGGRLNSDGFYVKAVQNAGIMCWQANSAGAIWLLADSRQIVEDASGALVIGWVADADIVLSRADRLTYVPECGYTKTTPPATSQRSTAQHSTAQRSTAPLVRTVAARASAAPLVRTVAAARTTRTPSHWVYWRKPLGPGHPVGQLPPGWPSNPGRLFWHPPVVAPGHHATTGR